MLADFEILLQKIFFQGNVQRRLRQSGSSTRSVGAVTLYFTLGVGYGLVLLNYLVFRFT